MVTSDVIIFSMSRDPDLLCWNSLILELHVCTLPCLDIFLLPVTFLPLSINIAQPFTLSHSKASSSKLFILWSSFLIFFVDIKESITLNRRWHPFWNVQFWKHQVWLAAVWRPVYHSWTMRRICWWREWLWPVAACVSAPKPSGGWSPALC